MNLDFLEAIDNLRKISFEKCECFIHEDHRWVLPIIHDAQEREVLPKPCTLVMFDAHCDLLDPICFDDICRIRKKGVNLGNLIGSCKDKLAKNDSDWIKAGMELGLIGDVVIFGVGGNWEEFKDHRGKLHRIELLSLPLTELESHDGKLCDLVQSSLFSKLWNILRWEYDQQKDEFFFKKGGKKILLDFALDCFVYNCLECKFPWPDELFESEFLTQSKNRKTTQWTGKKFLDGLIKRATLLTFSLESEFCGGLEKSEYILSKVNQFLFERKLLIEKEFLKIADVPIKWSRWYPWYILELGAWTKNGVRVPNETPGVYEVRRIPDNTLLICRGTKNIRRAIKECLIKGRYTRPNSLGKKIRHEEDLSNLIIRWCKASRPFTVEEQLRCEYKRYSDIAPLYL